MVITKSAAISAAKKMVDQLFDEELEALRKRERALGDRIAKKYFSAGLLKAVETYYEYVGCCTSFYVSDETSDSLELLTNIKLPMRSNRRSISTAEYKEVSVIVANIGIIKSRKYSTRVKIANQILSMRTYKRLEKEAPNLLEYFPKKDEGVDANIDPVVLNLREVSESLMKSKKVK